MNIVLIGFMGSGKSKVADVLSKKLGWDRVDTDEIVVRKAGCSIPELFRTRGEPAFRQMETDAVRDAALRDKTVISTGGGVPLNPGNLAELAGNGFVVWLKVSPETALRRAGDFSSRPLIDPKDPLGSISKRLQERIPYYSRAAASVDTDEMSVNAVAEKILSMTVEMRK